MIAIRHNLVSISGLYPDFSKFTMITCLQVVLFLLKIHETTLVSRHQSKIDAGLQFSVRITWTAPYKGIHLKKNYRGWPCGACDEALLGEGTFALIGKITPLNIRANWFSDFLPQCTKPVMFFLVSTQLPDTTHWVIRNPSWEQIYSSLSQLCL